MLIIPNGSHAAEKLARVKKAIRSEIKSANKNSTDPADLLLSGPFRDMHSAPVLESAKLLSEADPKRRAQAAQQLGLAGTEARTVLPLLRDRLNKEQDKTVRVRLAEAIVKVVPDDTAAVAELTKLLVDPEDWKVRQLAAAGLAAAAGGNNTQAVTMLTAAMNDGHPRVRTMVALTLGTFGPKAKAALPRLQFATSSDIPRVQEAAQAAIVCIAAETAPKSTIGNADGNDLESEPQLEQIPAGEIRTEQLENSPEKTAVDGSDPFAGTVFDFDSLDAASTQSPSH